jgi:hypothetical protein
MDPLAIFESEEDTQWERESQARMVDIRRADPPDAEARLNKLREEARVRGLVRRQVRESERTALQSLSPLLGGVVATAGGAVGDAPP